MAEPGTYEITAKNGYVYHIQAADDDQAKRLEGWINSRVDAGDADLKGAPPPEKAIVNPEVAAPAPPPAESAPQEKGVGGKFLDATLNTAAGIGQGIAALPDLAAQGIGKVLSAPFTAAGAAADALGFPNVSLQSHRIAHDLAFPITIGGLIEKAAPTPEGFVPHAARFGASLATAPVSFPGATRQVVNALVGEVPRVASQVAAATPTQGQRVFQSAERLGIEGDLIPADVGGTGTRMATSTASMTLGGIPLAEQSMRGINALAKARDVTAASAGSVADSTGAGLAAQSGARNFMASSERRATALYDAIPIEGTRSATLENTKSALGRLTAGLESNPELSALITDPRLQKFEQAIAGRAEEVPTGVLDAAGKPIMRTIQKGGELSWQDLKAFRTYVGEKAGAPALQSDTSQKALKALYGALSDDMAATAGQEGPEALKAFNRANQFWRGRQDRIENVVNSVLGNNLDKGAMSAFEGIQRLSNAKGGDPIKLGRLMRSLSPDEADTVRATILQKFGHAKSGFQDASGEVFSPAEFVTQWSNMSDRAKSVLFNKPELRGALDDLVEVAGGMKGAQKYANTSKTTLAANGIALLFKLFSNPAITVAVGSAELGAGQILSSPKLVRALAGVGRANTPSAISARIARFSAIAANDASVRPQALAIHQALRAINENAPKAGALAASPEQGPDQSYQQPY